MKVPLLDLKGQYKDIREECRAAIDAVCDDQYFILGPKVAEFEKNVADYCGVEHAVGVSSGTDALLIALMAFDIGAGDAVVTTPYTFFATAGCVSRLGAVPIFVDIDPVSFNIDPIACRKLLENIPERFKHLKIKALMPVHLYGQSADMSPLLEIAEEYGLKVIEDAAQAIGAEYPMGDKALRTGAMGDMGCFSFFPSKNLGGFGDGGMVVTSDAALAEKMVRLRNHGSEPKYYHPMVGGNFRLDALQAVVLNVKLSRLEKWHAARRKNAAMYNQAFEGTDVIQPCAVYAGSGVTNYHIYNQYIVRVSDRDATRARLQNAGIGNEVYYPVPLHMQECFKDLGYAAGDMPESEKAASETIALPIYPELNEDMIQYVISNIKM